MSVPKCSFPPAPERIPAETHPNLFVRDHTDAPVVARAPLVQVDPGSGLEVRLVVGVVSANHSLDDVLLALLDRCSVCLLHNRDGCEGREGDAPDAEGRHGGWFDRPARLGFFAGAFVQAVAWVQ